MPSRGGLSDTPQPLDRRAADACGFDRRSRRTQTATRLRAPFRSRITICRDSLSRSPCRPRPGRFHGPARQSLRQRKSGKLHEDAQSRGRLSNGLRDMRRCHRTFRISLTRSTTADGFTQHSAISVQSNSRINIPGRRSNQRPEYVRPEGPSPDRRPIFAHDDVIAVVAPLKEDFADGRSRRLG